MAFIRFDRAANTTTTTGTGDITLAGAALTAHRTIQSVAQVGDTFSYAIAAVDGSGAETGDWETGIGTYSATNTLTRTTVLASSNGGSAVSFSAGTKRVYMTALAVDINATIRSGSGAPSGINSTGMYVRTDAPFKGVIYNNGSTLDNSYAWSGRPTANSTNNGAVITITDWDQDFICRSFDGGSTYWWVPVHRRLKIVSNMTAETPVALNGTTPVALASNHTIPANLVIPGCKIEIQYFVRYANLTANTKSAGVRFAATAEPIQSRQATSAQAAAYIRGAMHVPTQTTQFHIAITQTDSGWIGGSVADTTNNEDFSASQALQFYAVAQTAGETTITAQLVFREIEIHYPVV